MSRELAGRTEGTTLLSDGWKKPNCQVAYRCISDTRKVRQQVTGALPLRARYVGTESIATTIAANTRTTYQATGIARIRPQTMRSSDYRFCTERRAIHDVDI